MALRRGFAVYSALCKWFHSAHYFLRTFYVLQKKNILCSAETERNKMYIKKIIHGRELLFVPASWQLLAATLARRLCFNFCGKKLKPQEVLCGRIFEPQQLLYGKIYTSWDGAEKSSESRFIFLQSKTTGFFSVVFTFIDSVSLKIL